MSNTFTRRAALQSGAAIVTELGPLESLTPARILAAFVTEGERLTDQLNSGELVQTSPEFP